MTDLHILSDPVSNFWKCPKKGFLKSDFQHFLEQNVSSTFCHQTSSTCHTDTTHGVEYGVSHPLTPSSSPVTALYCTVPYCIVLYCTILYRNTKRQKKTEIQKYRKTKRQKDKKAKRQKGKKTKRQKDKKTKRQKDKKDKKKYNKDNNKKDKKFKKDKQKKTKRQKDRKTKLPPTLQGAPKPSAGDRTRGP